ncbi:formylglycine-generating enzyme family protein [Litoreibacter janthinus]|uniref:Formylglycine-generating enzyme, required for sulfatase activity, contains SUMF1/FGE domain n=1 Tax=Litoreibacter janthinus TaxID=670154 RepID=A0A1I6H6L0_9RHOB|nr:SUMF1/EgtB/PvdO family nonheme iron enzyme [Litoreibacter janthinus]SFR50068.1 Formylglycine-generating enzyme, required for sulfatase activity, contains SUMF1/FGE domain [Litoreibacter janthinus]
MTTAERNKLPSRTLLRFAALGLLAAVAAGVALMQRGPDLTDLPVMAAAPIILPDGSALYVQRHEVTVAEWNKCVAQGACALKLRTRADQDPALTPATGLSYVDVQQYVKWINEVSGRSYRLPTAKEWNQMAQSVLPKVQDPIFTDPSLTWASAYLTEGLAPRALKPQGSFSTSPEGVVDLDGSVWEWTQECYAGVEDGIASDRCPAFFVGGEHVAAMSYLIRDPARGGCAVGTPPAHLGMRLVSDKPA